MTWPWGAIVTSSATHAMGNVVPKPRWFQQSCTASRKPGPECSLRRPRVLAGAGPADTGPLPYVVGPWGAIVADGAADPVWYCRSEPGWLQQSRSQLVQTGAERCLSLFRVLPCAGTTNSAPFSQACRVRCILVTSSAQHSMWNVRSQPRGFQEGRPECCELRPECRFRLHTCLGSHQWSPRSKVACHLNYGDPFDGWQAT